MNEGAKGLRSATHILSSSLGYLANDTDLYISDVARLNACSARDIGRNTDTRHAQNLAGIQTGQTEPAPAPLNRH